MPSTAKEQITLHQEVADLLSKISDLKWKINRPPYAIPLQGIGEVHLLNLADYLAKRDPDRVGPHQKLSYGLWRSIITLKLFDLNSSRFTEDEVIAAFVKVLGEIESIEECIASQFDVSASKKEIVYDALVRAGGEATARQITEMTGFSRCHQELRRLVVEGRIMQITSQTPNVYKIPDGDSTEQGQKPSLQVVSIKKVDRGGDESSTSIRPVDSPSLNKTTSALATVSHCRLVRVCSGGKEYGVFSHNGLQFVEGELHASRLSRELGELLLQHLKPFGEEWSETGVDVDFCLEGFPEAHVIEDPGDYRCNPRYLLAGPSGSFWIDQKEKATLFPKELGESVLPGINSLFGTKATLVPV